MAKQDFIKKPKHRDFMVMPALIFDDERLSIGAKGLYAQLYFSSSSISSLEEIVQVSTNSKEELDAYFDELVNIGYIVVKNGKAEFVIKTQSEKTVAKKVDQTSVDEFKNTVQEQPKVLNAYEKMVGLINTYKLDSKVTNLLISYFENWLNHKGRFAEAEQLHGYTVRSKINTLISFHMSDEDMITCIQNSIDKEWFVFVDQRLGSQPKASTNNGTRVNTSSIASFDKSQLTSGSYTEEDIQAIKDKAQALDAEGKKGIY